MCKANDEASQSGQHASEQRPFCLEAPCWRSLVERYAVALIYARLDNWPWLSSTTMENTTLPLGCRRSVAQASHLSIAAYCCKADACSVVESLGTAVDSPQSCTYHKPSKVHVTTGSTHEARAAQRLFFHVVQLVAKAKQLPVDITTHLKP